MAMFAIKKRQKQTGASQPWRGIVYKKVKSSTPYHHKTVVGHLPPLFYGGKRW